jgi:hypothetical protein
MTTKSLRQFEAQYEFKAFGGTSMTFVYNICDLIDYLELNETEYFESGKIIMEFAKSNNLSLYSAPRDSFSMYEACDLSAREKTAGVMVEDLS